MAYQYSKNHFEILFENPDREMTDAEMNEFEESLKYLESSTLMNNRPSKFASKIVSIQSDWNELPFYKKWYFHICKYFGVQNDWNKGKYMS